MDFSLNRFVGIEWFEAEKGWIFVQKMVLGRSAQHGTVQPIK
jgi:hypothetical protein